MAEADLPDGAPAGEHVRFGFDRRWIGPIAVIAVRGSLDMLTAPQLEIALAAGLNERPAAMIVDLSRVDFLASAGMAVLALAAEDAAAGGFPFGVVADGPATSRPLHLTNLGEILRLQPTLDEALADARRTLMDGDG